MDTYKTLLVILCTVLTATAAVPAETNQAQDKSFVVPKGQAQLFLDDELVASSKNVTRVWHKLHKHPANPLMVKSVPEKQLFLFGTVLQRGLNYG